MKFSLIFVFIRRQWRGDLVFHWPLVLHHNQVKILPLVKMSSKLLPRPAYYRLWIFMITAVQSGQNVYLQKSFNGQPAIKLSECSSNTTLRTKCQTLPTTFQFDFLALVYAKSTWLQLLHLHLGDNKRGHCCCKEENIFRLDSLHNKSSLLLEHVMCALLPL